MIAPMLLPPTASTGTPASSRARSTPTWTAPPCPASAEHETDRLAGQEAGETICIGSVAGADVVVRPHLPPIEPAEGARGLSGLCDHPRPGRRRELD